MKLDNLQTIDEMESFLNGSQPIIFETALDKDARYQCVEKLLNQFEYRGLGRADKGVTLAFLRKVSGFSRAQLTRLIKRYTEEGKVRRYQTTAEKFECRYTQNDIKLLADLDQRHDTPSGFMVKKFCERAFINFDEKEYERLSGISVSHIYNLRGSKKYLQHRRHFEKTKSKKGVHIGKRKKPNPNNQPGYIRIDTVHQGDQDGVKGVYHINAVDEVTQFEIVASVEKISEAYLLPVLEVILEDFPFRLINFHSDNGSEYVNKDVAKLLGKLLVEFTKSRPRHSNDNALAEGKNASVVRKCFGYSHIPQKYAKKLNEFNQSALNPYVNYHRPCLFPTTIINKKGREKKRYYYRNMATPYEKFKSLDNAEKYLKPGVTFEELDKLAKAKTDNQAADFLQRERDKLFKKIIQENKKIA